jgi:hypothetical protein
MNTAEGVRRLAQVIRVLSTVIAGIYCLIALVEINDALVRIYDEDWNAVGWSGFGASFLAGAIALVIAAIGHSVAWVLLGFAGDRAPPRGPGD